MSTLYRMPLRIAEVNGDGDPVTYAPRAFWPEETLDFGYRSVGIWLAEGEKKFATIVGSLQGMPATGVGLHDWQILKDPTTLEYEAVAVSTGHSVARVDFVALAPTARPAALVVRMNFVALHASAV